VPYAAGGGPDVLTRKMAIKLAEVLGKGAVVIVDNIVGAGRHPRGQNRRAHGARTATTFSSARRRSSCRRPWSRAVKFDPMKDFAHITRTVLQSVDPRGQRELALQDRGTTHRGRERASRASSTSPPAASAARATLCGAAMVLQARDRRGARALQGLGRDRAVHPSRAPRSSRFPIASTAIPQIQGRQGARAGRHRAAAHVRLWPDVPTLVEVFKAPDLALEAWFGLWAPAGLSPKCWTSCSRRWSRRMRTLRLRADSEAAGSPFAL
jgi:hypothetical protein